MFQLWKVALRIVEIRRKKDPTMRQIKDEVKKLGVMKEEE
jgi:hypothetical protein